MRYFFIFFVFPICSFSQITNRFYPPIKNILNIDPESKKIPISFNYYHNWVEKITDNFYYKDLQFSTSTKDIDNFYSLELIAKKQNKFNFGNSGLQLILNDDKSDFSYPIVLRKIDSHNINHLFSKFDMNTYNPENLKQQFIILNTFFNFSEEQILAQCMNRIIVSFEENDKKSNKTAYEILISDLKKRANVDISKIDLKENKLTNIVKEIYMQKKEYASSVLYDIYIKQNNNKKEEEKRLIRFYKGVTPLNYTDILKDIVGYSSNISIYENNVTIVFPNHLIQRVNVSLKDKKSSYIRIDSVLKLNPKTIKLKNYITKKKKGIEFTLENFSQKNNNNEYYMLPNELNLNKHLYLKKHEREFQIVNKKDIKSIIIFINEFEILGKIEFEIKDNNNYVNSYFFNFIKQPFSLN